jgi:formate hydrogenlyase subunit 4
MMQAAETSWWDAGGSALLAMVLIALLAPLLEGSIRKLRAIVHSRQGPPIIQPYLDLHKLLIKEDLRVSGSLLLRLGPVVFLGATLLAGSLVPLWAPQVTQFGGDVLVFAYLLALAAVAVVITGMAGGSPFSSSVKKWIWRRRAVRLRNSSTCGFAAAPSTKRRCTPH